jgi:hypothetical protein
MYFLATGGQPDTGFSSSNNALVDFMVQQHDGANNLADIDTDGNVFAVRARTAGAGRTKFIINEGGEVWHPGSHFIQSTSNAKSTLGLTVSQGGADDEILTLKSSDVGHSYTNTTEADTFFKVSKSSSTGGGASLWGFSEVQTPLQLVGCAGTFNADKDGGATGCIQLFGYRPVGGGAGTVLANNNLVTIENAGTSVWLVDAEGDMHLDGDVMPFDASTQSIGSSALPWSDIYCDTLHTSGGTVFIGDARLYEIGGLLYSESEIIAPSGSDPGALVTNQRLEDVRIQYGLSHDHDSDYYTQTYIDTNFAPASHGNANHDSTFITTAGVTYGALDGNSDIGTGSDQVAQGDHTHAYSAITGLHGNEDHSSTFIAGVSGDISPQLGGDLDLNGYSIDFGAILTVNETYEGKKMTVTVDDASTVFGNVLAQAADFNYDRADADAATSSDGLVMALESGSGSKEVLIEGQICDTDWNWSAGLLYLSVTTGAMSQTAPVGSGDQVVVVGWALSADTIYFRPSLVLAEIA